MTSFNEILNESYNSFAQLEWDVEEASRRDGFRVIKKYTYYSPERVLLKGAFRCYKNGTSRAKTPRTLKTNCPFKIHFRRQSTDDIYSFTSNHDLRHNHVLDPTSTTMTDMAR